MRNNFIPITQLTDWDKIGGNNAIKKNYASI
jgi:hypothetical protein